MGNGIMKYITEQKCFPTLFWEIILVVTSKCLDNYTLVHRDSTSRNLYFKKSEMWTNFRSLPLNVQL